MSDNTQEKNIFIFDAAEGMVLSQDIMTSTGHLIAAKDTVLTLDMIAKISEYNVLKINVYEEAAAQPEQPEVLEQMTYYEKIKQSQNFEHFNETFIDGINDLKTELNDIVINHETIDTTALLKNTEKILAEYTNTLQIFDMLHCMRDMDDLTYVHCINVAIIASILGKWLGYSEEDVKVLTLCGILHDIGKLLVPNEILSKPDRLTANEYAIIKEHVNLGYQIVKDADIDERVKSAILLHHEKCDGSGYPMGLKSEDIPDFAKIILLYPAALSVHTPAASSSATAATARCTPALPPAANLRATRAVPALLHKDSAECTPAPPRASAKAPALYYAAPAANTTASGQTPPTFP